MNPSSMSQTELYGRLECLEQQDWTLQIEENHYAWMGRTIKSGGNVCVIENLQKFISANPSIMTDKFVIDQLFKIEFKAKKAGFEIKDFHRFIIKKTRNKELLDLITLQEFGKKTQIPRKLLVLGSNYFKILLENGFKETKEKRVNFHDDERAIIGVFFNFLKKGKVKLNDKNAIELLKIASKYETLDLKEACERYLVNALSKKEMHDRLKELTNFAVDYQATILQRKLFEVVSKSYFQKFTSKRNHPLKKLGRAITSLSLTIYNLPKKQFCSLISYCPQLTFLELRNGFHKSKLPTSCPYFSTKAINHFLKHLQTLSIDGYQELTNDKLRLLSKGSIKLLKLTRCRNLTSAGMRHLPLLLKNLQIIECQKISDKGFENLPNALESLHLLSCHAITDAGLKRLPITLRIINLYACAITNEGIKELKKLTELKELSISACKRVDNMKFKHLPTELEELNLAWLDNMTNKKFKKSPKNLKRLMLTGFPLITNECFKDLPRGLASLGFIDCEKIDSQYFKRLPANLQGLDLSGCVNIDQTVLSDLPNSLRTLTVARWENLTDSGLKSLSQDIRFLNVSGCNKLTDQGMRHLSKKLLGLNVSDCQQFTSKLFQHLPKQLQCLNVKRCKNINPQDLKDFLKKRSLQLTSCEH